MWRDESCQLAKVVYMWQNGSCQLEKVVYMCKTVRASSKKWKDGSGLYIAKRFVPARKTGLGLYMVQRFVPAPKSGLGLYMWQNGLCQLAQVVLAFTFGKTVRASANRLQNVVWFSHLAKPVVPTSKSCFCSYIWQHLSAGFKTWFWPLNFGKKNIMRASKGLLDFPHLPIVLFFNIPGSLCNFLAFLEPCYFSPFVTACPCGTLSFCCAFVAFLFLVAPLSHCPYGPVRRVFWSPLMQLMGLT